MCIRPGVKEHTASPLHLIIKNFLSMAIEWLLMPETITFLYSLERSRWRKHDGQSSNCKNCQSFLSRDDLLFHVEATLHLQVMSRLLGRRRGWNWTDNTREHRDVIALMSRLMEGFNDTRSRLMAVRLLFVGTVIGRFDGCKSEFGSWHQLRVR